MRLRLLCSLLLATSLSAVCADQERAIFWQNDPVAPGEVVMVVGAGANASSTGMGPTGAATQAPPVWISRLPDAPADLQTAFGFMLDPEMRDRAQGEVLQHSPECIKFLLPADLKPGIFEYATGAGPGLLNAPKPTWLQGDLGHGASPGGWLRVFGRCLASENGPTRLAMVRATDGRPSRGAEPVEAELAEATQWAASFSIPEFLPAGEYCVSLHNGSGGGGGWSYSNLENARVIQVREPEQWPADVFDVTDFGASGEGGPEDDFAIQRALAAAEQNGGGVVYLPRGQYLASGTLRIPKRTVLKGEKREWVSIFWPETDEPALEGQVVGTDHFALEDLTLYCSNYTHIIVGDRGRDSGGNIRLERLRVRGDIFRGHLKQEEVAERFAVFMKQSTGGGDTVRLGGPNIVIRDCDLYGSGRSIWLQQADGAVVQGNTIYQGRWGWYSFDGCEGLIFENNSITGADLMSTGGGINCLSSSYSRNVYYAGNTLKLMHGWDREAMTTDAGGSAYYGGVKSCDGTTLTMNEPGDWGRGFKGAGVFILGGRGMGQHRRVVDYEGDQCVLDDPWIVEPDETSVITITMLHENYLFIGNHFEDAGIGLQYYGTSINNIAAGNTVARAGGFYNSGRWYHGYQPSWYCQFLGNEVLEGNCYRFGPDNATGAGLSFVGSWGVQWGENTAPLSLGSVVKGNKLHNNAKIELRGWSTTNPGLAHAVVEKNRVANSMVGIYQDPGCEGVLIRDNEFDNVTYETLDNEAIAARKRERLKKYIGRQEPIIHWAFDGDDAKSSPSLADPLFGAVAAGEPQLAEGVKGKAVRLDGSSYMMGLNTEALNLESFTLSAWINPDDINGRWGIIAKRTGNVASPYVLAVIGGRIEFNATDVVGKWSYNFQSGPVAKAQTWQHVAIVMDQEKGCVAYYNGAPVAEKQLPGETLVANDMRITVGFEAWGGGKASPEGSGNFIGMIDEVKVWARALSAEEIMAEYEAVGGANAEG